MKTIVQEILEFIEESPGFYHPINQRLYNKIKSLEGTELNYYYYYYLSGIKDKSFTTKIKTVKHEAKRKTNKQR
jgi:hypothetical protein